VSLTTRWRYLRRVFSAYVMGGSTQLSFWHETPEVNERAPTDVLGEYYMTFRQKADYAGPFDGDGIPQLDYRGVLGPQYNPIAIAQYGLANYNIYASTGAEDRRATFLRIADWMLKSLEQNEHGVWVWNHYFDWEYRDTLRAPWHSGLAQGQGISLLLRAYRDTDKTEYLDGAQRAFASMEAPTDRGGVLFVDEAGRSWIEEYIVHPPTHILNGFMWALWGVHDLAIATQSRAAQELWEASIHTLVTNLESFDTGYWSLYEQSGTRMKMMASPFYHSLHIVQLRVMYRLTGLEIFREFADRWDRYKASGFNRRRALAYKVVFKVLYY